MPWKETGPFEERRRFVMACEEADESFAVICERFGISRQNGYEWLARFSVRREGVGGSHRPLAFDAFKHEYNHERPHEALGQIQPAQLYQASKRRYPRDLQDPVYPRHFTSQRAYSNGVISVGRNTVVPQQLLGQPARRLEAIADGCWRVCFGPVT